MSREEEAIRATTRAIAATVRDVPPLRLEPAPGELWSPRRAPRGFRRDGSGHRALPWLAPLAAAAVIVAVAVTLVLVRGPLNGGVVPQSTATAALPGGVPRYYVALHPRSNKPGAANGLLAGDAVTGRALADITPPAHMSYQSVTAAADDRTFFAFATQTGGSPMAGLWFILVLAPGTDHVVTLASTAIAQQSGVAGSALSGSGRYLAVAENGPAKGQQRVVVFSVATGRPLLAWSTKTAPAMWPADAVQRNLLTWVNGDRAITFSGYDVARGTESVRRLSFPMLPGHGDLIADSQLIWSTSATSQPSCWLEPPVISADGKTIACAAYSLKQPTAGHLQWTLSWRSYQASAQAPAAGKYTIAYQVTEQVIQQAQASPLVRNSALLVSPSGSALIGEWAVASLPALTPSSARDGNGSGSTASMVLVGPLFSGAEVHVGVMSHGTFTPLRLAPGLPTLPAYAIAW
jgi:hypothetical protein